MSTEAATSQPKTADAATLQKALNEMISGVGLTGVGRVKERGPKTYEGETSEVITIESMGFIHTTYSRDANEHRDWPHAGDLVRFHYAAAKGGKEGNYRLSSPTFKVIAKSE